MTGAEMRDYARRNDVKWAEIADEMGVTTHAVAMFAYTDTPKAYSKHIQAAVDAVKARKAEAESAGQKDAEKPQAKKAKGKRRS